MKLAFIYDAVYPYEKGGAQKRIWELASRLADDHEVHLYGMHYWDGPAVVERDGVTLHGVCEPYDLYTDGRRSIPQALKFTAKLAPELLREDFDIIDCQEFPYFPIFVSKVHEYIWESAHVVTWYEVWDEYWFEYLGWKGAFGYAIERITSRLPEQVVPISSFIADDLREIGVTENVSVVENGVDFDGLQAIEPSDESWDIVYLGRLSEHKKVDLLLDAVNKASAELGRPVKTCIIGDGPERDKLERHAESIDVTDFVTFKGFVEADEDVIGTMKSSTVFVLPSIREGFPNTILEANACGVPSIIVDAPENGSVAVVDHGVTGFITEPSAKAIAGRIVDVLSDEELQDHLSLGAYEFGKAHDWDAIVTELEEVYSRTMTRSTK